MPIGRGDDLVIRLVVCPSAQERRTMFDSMLTDADRQYLRRVEEFCREKVDPHCAQWDEDENLPREVFSDAGRLGLLGMIAPVELGGRGLTFVAYTQALMTLGRHSAALAVGIAAQTAWP